MFRRILSKLLLRRNRAGYRSPFGGLWIDALDAGERLEQKLARGEIDAPGAELLRFWRDKGYLIIPAAVDAATIDQINRETEAAWVSGDHRLKVDLAGASVPLEPSLRSQKAKLLDLFAFAPTVCQAMFAPKIRDFLRLIFGGDILAFQTLSFEHGTEQEMHQDTAYVVVSSPMELCASWIALQDVEAGSGELVYYEGSHRIDGFRFHGNYRNFNRQRDGEEIHKRYLDSLHEQARKMGLEQKVFRPRKGDALIWSADLVHGGSKITLAGRTRRSLVTHYCPNRCAPYYFAYLPEHRLKRRFTEGCYYSSSHYALKSGAMSG